jgi:two-component system, NtrC family, sensor kinase
VKKAQGQDDLNTSRELLGQLADMMPQNPSVRDVLQRVLWLARQFDWSDSAVVFLKKDGKLLPETYRTPYHDRLVQVAGLGAREPLVSRALDERRAVKLTESERLASQSFSEEHQAIAVPIHDYGVLYLGRRADQPFSETVITNLVALCQQAHFALMVARLTGSKRALQMEESESRRTAESLLDSMSTIVEVMSEILTLTEPEDVLKMAGDSLNRVADFEFWCIIAGETDQGGRPDYFLTGPAGMGSLDKNATLELAQTGIKSGRTLSFMNMNRLSLPQPSPNILSVLICPMIADGQTIGCLTLGSVRPCFFRHERELLSTLALQVGSHFWNLHLHRQVAVAHESLKLSQAQLIQSSKMAAVGQLAAGVAHEMNTPLGAMNLAIEGALRVFEKKPERALSRLERALRSGNQLREIVSKLLHYSKKTDSKGQETDLNDVLNDSLNLIGHQLRLNGIEVETEQVDLPLILVNQNEMQQAVINLLTNAKDAILSKGQGEPCIAARTYTTENTVELAIQDNGTGMDDKTRGRVFEPFFTTKDVGHGTGLGLSVTKEIVERNNGTVEIETSLGEGSKIILKFKKPNVE